MTTTWRPNPSVQETERFATATIDADGVLTINLTGAQRVFYCQNTASITSVNIINAPENEPVVFTVHMISDGNSYDQNWTAGTVIIWGDNGPPDFTAIQGHDDMWSAMIDETGEFYYGSLNNQNYTIPA